MSRRSVAAGLWRGAASPGRIATRGALVGQRYAYDLVAAEDAEKLENPCRYRMLSDWATYGAPVVAAAPGRVVKAVDGVPDNTSAG